MIINTQNGLMINNKHNINHMDSIKRRFKFMAASLSKTDSKFISSGSKKSAQKELAEYNLSKPPLISKKSGYSLNTKNINHQPSTKKENTEVKIESLSVKKIQKMFEDLAIFPAADNKKSAKQGDESVSFSPSEHAEPVLSDSDSVYDSLPNSPRLESQNTDSDDSKAFFQSTKDIYVAPSHAEKTVTEVSEKKLNTVEADSINLKHSSPISSQKTFKLSKTKPLYKDPISPFNMGNNKNIKNPSIKDKVKKFESIIIHGAEKKAPYLDKKRKNNVLESAINDVLSGKISEKKSKTIDCLTDIPGHKKNKHGISSLNRKSKHKETQEQNNRMGKSDNNMPFTRLVVKDEYGNKQFTAKMLNSLPDEVLAMMDWKLKDIQDLPRINKTNGMSDRAIEALNILPRDISFPHRARYFGEGGYGKVKFALLENYPHMGHDYLCVAKKIKPIKNTNNEKLSYMREQLKQEVALQNQAGYLSPKIHGFVETVDKKGNPEFVIFMDQAKGINGLDFILGSPLSFDQKKQVMLETIKTTQRLHRKGITHKDLKWENVSIDKDSNKVQLLDYGYAVNEKTFDTMFSNCSLSLAPELTAEGVKEAAPMDIFSMGVMLIDLFQDKKYPNPFMNEEEGIELWQSTFNDLDIQQIIDYKLEQVRIDNQSVLKLITEMVNPYPDQRPSLAEVEDRIKRL